MLLYIDGASEKLVEFEPIAVPGKPPFTMLAVVGVEAVLP